MLDNRQTGVWSLMLEQSEIILIMMTRIQFSECHYCVAQIFCAPSFDDKILEVVAVFGGMQMAVSRVIKLQHHRIAQVRAHVKKQRWRGVTDSFLHFNSSISTTHWIALRTSLVQENESGCSKHIMGWHSQLLP